MLKGIDAGGEKINFRSDGVPELAGKPFTITDRGDGSFALQVQARSEEEFIRLIPHIAAKLKIPEDQLRQMLTSANAGYITKRPGPVHHPLAFGGPDAVRSITKSCLELWAVAVGNDEVWGDPRRSGYAETAYLNREDLLSWPPKRIMSLGEVVPMPCVLRNRSTLRACSSGGVGSRPPPRLQIF
jgi:hypothetical protein